MTSVPTKDLLRICQLSRMDDNLKAKLSRGFKKKEAWAAADILHIPEKAISAEDKLYIVLRKAFIPAPVLREIAHQFTKHVLPDASDVGNRAAVGEAIASEWHRRKTAATAIPLDETQCSAQAKAWTSAYFAAWASALPVFQVSNWCAAWVAASLAAQLTEWDTAMAEERKWQCSTIIRILEAQESGHES